MGLTLKGLQDLLPPLATDEYVRLVASIEKDGGLRIPILRKADSEEIIDGYHRLKACEALGIEASSESVVVDYKEALKLAVVLNLGRRQVSREKIKELYKALRQTGEFTQEELSDMVGIPRRSLSDWDGSIGEIANSSIPDLRYKLTKQAKEEIKERYNRGETQEQIAADYGISRRRVGQIVNEPESPEPLPWPEMGKYRCIVIDPAWPIKKIERETVPTQGESLDFSIMSLDEIEAIPISELASSDGCHVYLWTTHKFLHEAFHILKSWGVTYECTMVWHKEGGFTPYSFQYNCEFVLFGRIGKLDVVRKGLKLCFQGKRRGHSVKPDEFYDLVVQASPAPRLNMYARQEREGFEAWGAEAP